MLLVRAARARSLREGIAERTRLHARSLDATVRCADQLARFNGLWARIRTEVPYYVALSAERGLPRAFDSWEAVCDSLPVMSRENLRAEGARLVNPTRPPDAWRATGGTSATPVQFPVWSSELAYTTPDIWIARGWYGITPADRVFLLWGHRHLLGTGFKARIKGWERRIRDAVLGYRRWSAYDLSTEGLRRAGEALLRFHPTHAIGYSVALDLMARANADRAAEFAALRMKAIIATAEGFPSADSSRVVSEVFGAPAAMEYGAVETTVMAHTTPAHAGFEVFWNNHFLEATEPGPGGGRILRITSLYPRCTPLIRYEVGDEVALCPGDDGLGLARFDRVIGRCNAFLLLPDGTRIHSEAITHVVSSCADVGAYQAVQEGTSISMLLTAARPISGETVEMIRGRLARIHPGLASVAVRQVDRLRQTIAGKTPMILRVQEGSAGVDATT